jgi:hypothetical protein
LVFSSELLKQALAKIILPGAYSAITSASSGVIPGAKQMINFTSSLFPFPRKMLGIVLDHRE